MSVFDKIQEATQEAKDSGKSVEIELTDDELNQYLGTVDVRPGAAGVRINQSASSPIRVILKHRDTEIFISV